MLGVLTYDQRAESLLLGLGLEVPEYRGEYSACSPASKRTRINTGFEPWGLEHLVFRVPYTAQSSHLRFEPFPSPSNCIAI
jgi:hypothetical protein